MFLRQPAIRAEPESAQPAPVFLLRGSRRSDSLGLMIAVALAARLAVCVFLYHDLLDPTRDYWHFGWETGRIAHSIASGRGFASPLFGSEGPTAWMAPVYPYLLAGIFRVFGSFTTASAWSILALNSLFSAAACFPIYQVGKMAFDHRVARAAGWAWAFYPYAIYFAAARVWETCLTTLLVSLVIWMTVLLLGRRSLPTWLLYGGLWALTALTSPVSLTVLPGLAGWVWYRMHRESRDAEFIARAALAACIFLVAVSPWFMRNYLTFHSFIPFRDNLWLEVRMGNTGDTSDVYVDWAHPAHSAAELQKFQTLGELAYFQEKKAQALDFIGRYPGMFLWLTLRRFTFMWTGFWSFRHEYLANEPFEIPDILLSTTVSVWMLIGIKRAWHGASAAVIPLVLCIITFPLVYYVTRVDPNYRHPVDPEIVTFVVFGFLSSRRTGHPKVRNAG